MHAGFAQGTPISDGMEWVQGNLLAAVGCQL